MQQELAPAQRRALHQLLESLDVEPPDLDTIVDAAGRVSELLGVTE